MHIGNISFAGSIKSPDAVTKYAVAADADTPRNTSTPFSSGGMAGFDGLSGIVFKFFNERLAHPPLGARASVDAGFDVVIIINACKQSGS